MHHTDTGGGIENMSKIESFFIWFTLGCYVFLGLGVVAVGIDSFTGYKYEKKYILDKEVKPEKATDDVKWEGKIPTSIWVTIGIIALFPVLLIAYLVLIAINEKSGGIRWII